MFLSPPNQLFLILFKKYMAFWWGLNFQIILYGNWGVINMGGGQVKVLLRELSEIFLAITYF